MTTKPNDPRSTITWKKIVREMTATATTCAVCGYMLRKHDPA
jgi:hypothetical protein